MRYLLDPSARRIDGGRVLLAGSPLVLFRLGARGAALVDAIAAGDDLTMSPAEAPLIDRLLDAGTIHPRPTPPRPAESFRPLRPTALPAPGDPGAAPGGEGHRRPGPSAGPGDVTVVIPTLGRPVDHLLGTLDPASPVIVVDDGSDPPVAAPSHVRVIRLPHNRGPAAARNAGLAAADTPLVAFVDADTLPAAGWLDVLLPHFTDPRVGLVAPRVTSPAPPGAGRLARYEATRSPLDLGPLPARIRAGTRVSYVPAAALVVRTGAMRGIGGFDEHLRLGEDVDLVWRLDEVGWRCRYEPTATVTHEARPTTTAWLAQRAGYGRSAASLAHRHPGSLAPVRVSAWSATAWGLATLAPQPVGLAAGTAVTATASALLARKVDALEHPHTEAARLAGLGTLHAGRQLAGAITRAWWPVAVAAALVSRRARRVVAAATLVPPLVDWARRRPGLDPVTYTVLRAADDAAYGWGVWRGVVAERTAGPLIPDLTSWPGRTPRST